jgi:hypothetical protein
MTDIRQIQELIDATQQMIRRNKFLNRELVKQSALRHLTSSHHRYTSTLKTCETMTDQPINGLL